MGSVGAVPLENAAWFKLAFKQGFQDMPEGGRQDTSRVIVVRIVHRTKWHQAKARAGTALPACRFSETNTINR